MEENNIGKEGNKFTGDIDINADESIPGTTHMNDVMEEESELDKVQSDLEQQKDKYLRLVAEFDNFKRRNAKERMELIQTAGKEVIIAMLDVLDDTDRAEKQLQNTDDLQQVKDGVSLVFNKLRSVLKSKGLKAMETIHTEFDSEIHEAITEIPAPSDKLKGKVIDEVSKDTTLTIKLFVMLK